MDLFNNKPFLKLLLHERAKSAKKLNTTTKVQLRTTAKNDENTHYHKMFTKHILCIQNIISLNHFHQLGLVYGSCVYFSSKTFGNKISRE